MIVAPGGEQCAQREPEEVGGQGLGAGRCAVAAQPVEHHRGALHNLPVHEHAAGAVDVGARGEARPRSALRPLALAEPERRLGERPGVLGRGRQHRDVGGANATGDGARDRDARIARVPRAVDERGRRKARHRQRIARGERLERFSDAGRERGGPNRRIGDAVRECGEVALDSARSHHVMRHHVGERRGERRLHAVRLRWHRVELAEPHAVSAAVDGVGGVVAVRPRLLRRRIGRGVQRHVAPGERLEPLAEGERDHMGVGDELAQRCLHGVGSPSQVQSVSSTLARASWVLRPHRSVGTWYRPSV